MLGVVSVFNSAAINSASVVKGAFPARYSGRLSSLVDVRMKEGNMEEFHGEVGMGLLSGRASLEGPIVKDKASFIVSGRRTWLDLLVVPLQKLAFETRGSYFFHDVNAKVNWRISPKDRIFLSGYLGRDKASLRDVLLQVGASSATDETSIGYGNQIAALRWNHLFGQKLFCNTTFTFSRYNSIRLQHVEQQADTSWFQLLDFFSKTEIQDWAGRVDFDFFPHPRHAMKFGGGSNYHSFTPTVNSHTRVFRQTDTTYTLGAPRKFAHESFLYFEDDIGLSRRFRINPGMHIAAYAVDEERYISLQPRFSARYLIDENNSLK